MPQSTMPSPRRSGKITLKSVAEAAGVSVMAVSVVMNNAKSGTRVSEETRKRIQAVAAELGYHPNSLAQALRRQATYTIGVHSGFRFLDTTNLFVGTIIGGVHWACIEHGYDLLLRCRAMAFESDDPIKVVREGRVDGMIVLSPPDDEFVALLAENSFPAVALADEVNGLPSVFADNDLGGRLQARHLHKLGHKKILYVADDWNATSIVTREKSFLQESKSLGLETTLVRIPRRDFPEALLQELPSSRPHRAHKQPPITFAVLEDVAHLIAHKRHSAVVCWNDANAHQLLDYLENTGVQVPEDVSFVGFDHINTPVKPKYDLTSIDCDWPTIVRAACDILFARIRGENVPVRSALPVTLHPGATCRHARPEDAQ